MELCFTCLVPGPPQGSANTGSKCGLAGTQFPCMGLLHCPFRNFPRAFIRIKESKNIETITHKILCRYYRHTSMKRRHFLCLPLTSGDLELQVSVCHELDFTERGEKLLGTKVVLSSQVNLCNKKGRLVALLLFWFQLRPRRR